MAGSATTPPSSPTTTPATSRWRSSPRRRRTRSATAASPRGSCAGGCSRRRRSRHGRVGCLPDCCGEEALRGGPREGPGGVGDERRDDGAPVRGRRSVTVADGDARGPRGDAAVTIGSGDLREARARRQAALLSVAAAVVLVTGSLAFVAEAVHSGTDLVAALLTLFAVRVAIRPPDREHHYGHGKAEHLAALGESAFLGIVSVFIGAESLRRLIDGGGHEVETTWWAFTVLGVVIAVDAWRALASRRAALRHRSAAFAANALHFGSDLAGSLAVLVGLVLVAAGEPAADAAAALFVAALVVIAALRLARQSVDVLMDRAAVDAEERIRQALNMMAEPVELRRARVRHAAGRHFADLVVAVPLDAGVTQAH